MLVTIDASEVHDLADDIRRNADETPARAVLAVKKTGFDMEATAKVNAPVDTGFLMNSISTDFDSDGLGFELGPTAEYGLYVEEGTGEYGPTGEPFEVPNAFGRGTTVLDPGMPPQPYLGPAFDIHLPNLERALGAIGDMAVSRRG